MARFPFAPDGSFGVKIQQATEKLLKALLSQLGVEYPRTHDLESLVILLESVGEVLPKSLMAFPPIQSFAVEHRYDDVPEYAVLDRIQSLETVQILREHVLARIATLSTGP